MNRVQEECKILVVVDIEGIIGVVNMNDVNHNLELAYKEVNMVISELKKNNFSNITICNIHNDGTFFNENKITSFGAQLIQGVQNLVPIVNEYSFAFMIGFHCKKNSGWRFDHTFRADIEEMKYGEKNIGEVGAFYRWLTIEKVPVLLVSGEGNFQDEIKEFNCINHMITIEPSSRKIIQEEYMKFQLLLQKAINAIKNKDVEYIQIMDNELIVKVNNSDKCKILQHKYETSEDKLCFYFESLTTFFSQLYSFALELSEASRIIYRKNNALIAEIKKTGLSKNELSIILNEYLKKDVFEISRYERDAIAKKVRICFEDLFNN